MPNNNWDLVIARADGSDERAILQQIQQRATFLTSPSWADSGDLITFGVNVPASSGNGLGSVLVVTTGGKVISKYAVARVFRMSLGREDRPVGSLRLISAPPRYRFSPIQSEMRFESATTPANMAR